MHEMFQTFRKVYDRWYIAWELCKIGQDSTPWKQMPI